MKTAPREHTISTPTIARGFILIRDEPKLRIITPSWVWRQGSSVFPTDEEKQFNLIALETESRSHGVGSPDVVGVGGRM